VHDLEDRERLHPLRVIAERFVDVRRPDEREEENCAAEDSGPQDGGNGVVGYQAVLRTCWVSMLTGLVSGGCSWGGGGYYRVECEAVFLRSIVDGCGVYCTDD